MEILSVSLANFKSHRDRHFSFQPGTNAICGENGAGKTSILEAIAWVLFDYTGDYIKDDLIRNGASSAQVRISFISSRDGRTYDVQRCTTKSYSLFDPQLNERLPYTRVKEEVLPWLRQHLGVAPGTDLGKLFASTIGVPQGTFTADFLLTKENRKPIFDKILKVEEYQQTWKKMGDLEKFAKFKLDDLDREVARYDEELKNFASLQQQREDQQQEIEQVQTNFQQAQAQVAKLEVEQVQLSQAATQLQQLEEQLKRLSDRIQDQSTTIDRLQADLKQAEDAAAVCTQHRAAFQIYSDAEAALQALQKSLLVEQSIQAEKRRQEKLLGERQTRVSMLSHQLQELANAKLEIGRLAADSQQQAQLEEHQQAIVQQLQHCAGWKQACRTQEKQLLQAQTRQKQLEQDITRIQGLARSIQTIPRLEQQQQRYQQQLSRIEAAVQFEADLRQLLAQSEAQHDRYLTQTQQAEATLKQLQQAIPTWSDAIAVALDALDSGTDWQQQLMEALQTIVDDLAEQTSVAKLEQQIRAIHQELQTARNHQAEFSTLETLNDRASDLATEIHDLQANLSEINAQLSTEPTLKLQQAQLAAELEALGDPRGQIRLLTQKLHQQPNLEQQMQAAQESIQDITTAIAQFDAQLADYADLPHQLQTQQALKEEHREAYQEYLAYRELANTRRDRKTQLNAALEQLQTFEQDAMEIMTQRDRLQAAFDPIHFQAVQTAYQTAKEQCIGLKASLPDKLKLLAALDQRLADLRATQAKRDQIRSDAARAKQQSRFIKFARQAYKNAGPRITERYVQNISREADKLFRELLNRSNVGLEWTRDYDILVREGAHTRRFVNLSGGEQMCAALAVRLALLKVLADIDIAFFDEPTTNMDRPRRQHLAEAIANIRSFRQLFVISHDDTFEQITENIIVVQRELE